MLNSGFLILLAIIKGSGHPKSKFFLKNARVRGFQEQKCAVSTDILEAKMVASIFEIKVWMVPQLHSFLCKMKNIFYKMFLFFKLFLNRTNNPPILLTTFVRKSGKTKLSKGGTKSANQMKPCTKNVRTNRRRLACQASGANKKKLFVQLATGWATSWQKVQHPLVAGQRCVRVHRYRWPISQSAVGKKNFCSIATKKCKLWTKGEAIGAKAFRKVKWRRAFLIGGGFLVKMVM